MVETQPRERPGNWRRGLRSFNSRNFRLWFLGQTVSQVGYFMQTVALALLIIELTDDGSILGLAALAHYLPIVLLAPWAGVLCDRVDKRELLFWSQVVLMAAAFLLGLMTFIGASIAAVMVLATLTGVASGIDHPARRIIVVELVDPEDEASAVSLNTMISNGAKIVGPSIAAIVAGLVGTGWCFIINGLTFVAVLTALKRMNPEEMRSPPLVERQKGQIREGIKYALQEPGLRSTIALLGLEAMLIFNWNILLPLFVQRELRGAEGALGVLMSAMAIGALSGSLWLARHPVTDMRYLGSFAVLVGTGHVLVAVSPTVPVAAAFCFFTGAGAMLLFNAGQVRLQLGAAPAMRGRVMALFGMFFLGGIAVGGPVFGWLAEETTVRRSIAIAGIAAVGGGVVALVSRHSDVGSGEPHPYRSAIVEPV